MYNIQTCTPTKKLTVHRCWEKRLQLEGGHKAIKLQNVLDLKILIVVFTFQVDENLRCWYWGVIHIYRCGTVNIHEHEQLAVHIEW